MDYVLPKGQCNKSMKEGQPEFHLLKGWKRVFTCKDGHSVKVGQFVVPKWCNKEVA